MEKLKEYKYIILIGLVVFGFVFYWFQLRPTQIRKECMSLALEEVSTTGFGSVIERYQAQKGFFNNEKINSVYLNCIRAKGLNK